MHKPTQIQLKCLYSIFMLRVCVCAYVCMCELVQIFVSMTFAQNYSKQNIVKSTAEHGHKLKWLNGSNSRYTLNHKCVICVVFVECECLRVCAICQQMKLKTHAFTFCLLSNEAWV